MAQDLRDLSRKLADEPGKPLPKGHKKRFSERLDQEFRGQQSTIFLWWKVAAAVVVAVGIGSWVFFNAPIDPDHHQSITDTSAIDGETTKEFYTLSDLSPDFEKVENFYLTGIQMELANLKVDDTNKEFVSGYLKRLEELNDEYQVLNQELNYLGPNEQTIQALIDNLQRRLDLIIKLKNNLHQFNQTKNEQFQNQQA